jgi:hypothetical protein
MYILGRCIYTRVNSGFPSELTEARGYFVGFAPNVGNIMAFKVLSTDTNKIIFQSNVRSVLSSDCPNYRLSTDGEIDKEDFYSMKLPSKSFVQSAYNNEYATKQSTMLPGFSPHDLIGRTFFDTPRENGIQHWVKVTKAWYYWTS